MKKQATKLLCGLLVLVMLLGLLPSEALAAGREIREVELTFAPPAIGQVLDFEPQVNSEANYEINYNLVDWYKDWGELGYQSCATNHKVEPGVPYTVFIDIKPKAGYTFPDPEEVTVKVNGSTEGVKVSYDSLYTGITCEVSYEELGYTISFNKNGGIHTMEDVTNVYGEYTIPECKFVSPNKKMFSGWNVGSPSGPWYYPGSSLEVNSDITLYAQWAEPGIPHKITFINPAYDPMPSSNRTVEEGLYTLPEGEDVFDVPDGSYFECWAVDLNGDGLQETFEPGDKISVIKNLMITAIWQPIPYEYVNSAVFEVKLNPGAQYKHGMLAGFISVSLKEDSVSGSFNEGAPQPFVMESGGYGHSYWISSDDMLPGTDALSTTGSYRLNVVFDVLPDRYVRFHPDGISIDGAFGSIGAWSVQDMDDKIVAQFKLPPVPGTALSAEQVTFTLNGYEAEEKVTGITVGANTPHVFLEGSGYDDAYTIYEEYVDADTAIRKPSAVFENHTDYCLMINYTLEEGFSFPDSFWEDGKLIKEKFKLSGFEDAVVTAATRNHITFRLPQLGTATVESLTIGLNGYEPGKYTGDVSLSAPDCMSLPHLDVESYPAYGRLYCYFDPSHYGSTDGDFAPIGTGVVLQVGDQYPFVIKFYPVDGYEYTDLKKEDITLITCYGNCTPSQFWPGTTEDSYWMTFDLPEIKEEMSAYPVTVKGGTAAPIGAQAAGSTITIIADAAPAGKRFKEWTGADNLNFIGGTGKSSATAAFSMPAKAVTVTAAYEDIPVPKTLDSIAITTPPTKIAYTAGETFDSTGMVVKASYSDSSTAPVTGYTVSPAGALSQSNTKITVTYTEGGVSKSAVQAITVTAAGGSGAGGSTGGSGTGKPAEMVFQDVPAGAYYYDAVLWAAENGITSGTDAIHFSPDMTCTRAQVVTFLWRAAGSPQPKSSAMPFKDVAAGAYYCKAVQWAIENGITKGISDTAFAPDDPCTRGQVVTFLWRAQKSPAAESANPFVDVRAGAYYADAVLWAVKNGITNGTSPNTFSPDAPCSRAQIVTFLYRSMGK